MEQAYLPGNTRDRILDLMKEYKITQADLAVRIGCSESKLSRFLSGSSGNPFLTYATPAIRNAMLDYIDSLDTIFESKKYVDIVYLDKVHAALNQIPPREKNSCLTWDSPFSAPEVTKDITQ